MLKTKTNKKRNNLFSMKAGLLASLIPLSFLPQPAQAMLTIVVSATVDLNFGSVTESGAGGTVTITPAGARSVGGSVTAVTGAGLESNGMILVSGSTGLAIDLSMAAAAFPVSNGTDTMIVNAFNINGSGNAAVVTLAVNPTAYPYGATLNVTGSQGAGTYNGSFTVNANYQ